MVTILSPKVLPTGAHVFRLASRPVDLNGKTIGFLDNGKRNFNVFLDRLQELIGDAFKFSAVYRRKPHALKGIPRELFEELADVCDVVVTGSGD